MSRKLGQVTLSLCKQLKAVKGSVLGLAEAGTTTLGGREGAKETQTTAGRGRNTWLLSPDLHSAKHMRKSEDRGLADSC